MKVAVLSFPGSNCDLDTLHVLRSVLKVSANLVWHKDDGLEKYDAAIIPGGFSYGDYLRAGVMAAYSPAMKGLRRMAEAGKPVLGICNGFQILVEAGLLPGALMRNSCLKFVCRWANVRVETERTAFTKACPRGSLLRMPVAHNEGRFFLDEDGLKELQSQDQIVFRYVDESGAPKDEANPNGSLANIAGICNREGNVVGLMPHPERASEGLLSPFGSEDGLLIFRSTILCLEGL